MNLHIIYITLIVLAVVALLGGSYWLNRKQEDDILSKL